MKPQHTESPTISVIVPSYNSASTIRNCLESIIGQHTKLSYEVIVVDSSTDTTPEIVGEFDPHVTLVHSRVRLFPGPARNLGIDHARAGIIAFTDSDCVVDAHWIDNIHRAHQSHDAVGGRILNGTPRSAIGTALYLTEFAEFGSRKPRLVPSVPTCNMSYKTRVFEEYGSFPDVFWGEEYILNTRIVEKISFAPEIVVTHMNRTAFGETVRHSYKVGNGCALSRVATNRQEYLFRFKFLIPFVWLYRLAKIGVKAVQAGNAPGLIVSLPFLMVDLLAWNAGFLRGAIDYAPQRDARQQKTS
jgi:glycosyltransferase involved in cell wall biosynthesis